MTTYYQIKKNSKIWNKYLGGLLFTCNEQVNPADGCLFISMGINDGRHYLVKFSFTTYGDCFEKLTEPQPKEYTQRDMISFGQYLAMEVTDLELLDDMDFVDIISYWSANQNE